MNHTNNKIGESFLGFHSFRCSGITVGVRVTVSVRVFTVGVQEFTVGVRVFTVGRHARTRLFGCSLFN